MEQIIIRTATPGDAPALLEIYSYYVNHTAITFEYVPPTEEVFRQRIGKVLEKYPFLVAQRGEELLGYAYAGTFIGRAACDRSVETSIYLRHTARRQGVGRLLYQALEDVLKAQNILNLNASIAYPVTEDPYLTRNSAEFHAHMGFRPVGTFHACGYKFGRWYDLIWMERSIGPHGPSPAPVIPFPQLGRSDTAAGDPSP